MGAVRVDQLGLEIVEKGKEEAAKYHKQSDFFLSSHTNLISFLFPHNNFDLLDLVAALCPTPGESNLCFLPQLKISSSFFQRMVEPKNKITLIGLSKALKIPRIYQKVHKIYH